MYVWLLRKKTEGTKRREIQQKGEHETEAAEQKRRGRRPKLEPTCSLAQDFEFHLSILSSNIP